MSADAERHIRAWLEQFVVGLDLCPFARPLLGTDSLRIAVCRDSDRPALRRAFLQELDYLQGHAEAQVATTLLAFPEALTDFDDYLDFASEAQELLLECGLEGIVQVASFHPRYQFEGEDEKAASHFSNRAPYPLIHLLRESMLTRVLADFPEPERIPDRNIETLNGLGAGELMRRWQRLFHA